MYEPTQAPLSDCPYFWASAWLAAAGTALIVAAPCRRKVILSGGLMSLPAALFVSHHVPAYWNPKFALLICRRPLLSVDDLLFCFGIGTLSTWFALHLGRLPWTPQASFGGALGRYSLCGGAGALVASAVQARLPPQSVMFSCLAGLFATGAAALMLKRGVRQAGRYAGLPFTCLFLLVLVICGRIWPEAAAYYNPAAQPAGALFGIPVLEIVFPFCFGTVWPVVVAACADVAVDEPVGAAARECRLDARAKPRLKLFS
jgi:hypothetical protein